MTATTQLLDEMTSRTAPPVLPCRFLGIGTALPAAVVTNLDLVQHLDTTDAWITERTGIRARHVAGHGETTAELAVQAGQRALDDAGVSAESIDLIVLATSTPDQPCPATAAQVAARLGTRGAAFDVNAACSGFAYAVHLVAALLADPGIGMALVIGADRLTSLVDPDDRSIAVLFGDGAGAVVMGSGTTGDAGILGSDVGGDPTGIEVIHVPAGTRYLTMDGQELFRRATRALANSGFAALQQAGATPDDVDLYVPHQANARIISAAAHRLGIPPERTVISLAQVGNTSAASLPLGLAAAREDGRLPDGTRVLLTGVGAGLAWSSLYLRWAR